MDVDEEKWMEFQVEHKHWHGLVGLNGLVFMLYIQCNTQSNTIISNYYLM